MKVAVCVKPVPDLENLSISQSQGRVFEKGKRKMNPFDASAVEAAAAASLDSIAVSVGTAEDAEVLRRVLALGVAGAVLVASDRARSFDHFQTAAILARTLEKLGVDAAYFGPRSPDGALGQTAWFVRELVSRMNVRIFEPSFEKSNTPGAMAIMKAFKKPMTIWSPSDVGATDVAPRIVVRASYLA